MSESTQTVTDMVTHSKPSLIQKFASKYSIDADKLMVTLKHTAFRQSDGAEPTNEQMAALLVVADQFGLNPFTREIYAFPDRNKGIVPIIGVDGWSRIINTHSEYNGMEFSQSDNIIHIEGAMPCPEWIECVMYRKDREHPTRIKEYLDEVYQPPRGNYRGPWQTHTKRFLRHKAMIQCARIAFGFVGIYEQDEGERIINAQFEEVTTEQSTSTSDLNDQIKSANAKRKNGQVIDVEPDQKPVPPKSDTKASSGRGKSSKTKKAAESEAPAEDKANNGPSYAEIADKINKATNSDDVDVAIDLTNSIADLGQREELLHMAEEKLNGMGDPA